MREGDGRFYGRQRELEADLQFLLDAQAEGLLAGLGSGVPDDQTSTGSTTPTARSVRSSVARSATKPLRRKPGLRSARKGIYNSILALAALKEDESRALELDVVAKQDDIQQIDGWANKKQGLQQVTQGIEASEDSVRSQRLRQEADILQQDINGIELQLSDMKSRHRQLLRQAEAVENSVQAKLASYIASLNMLESDVKHFLSRPRERQESRPNSAEGKMSVWQLPPKRRTLDMAKDQAQCEREEIVKQRETVELEREALEEGAVVWKDVVAEVTEFEKRLRSDMSSLPMSSSNAAWEDEPPPQHDSSQQMKEVLTQMDVVIRSLETKLEHAQSKNWKLLIASISAELDAFEQGKTILEGALVVSGKGEIAPNDERQDDIGVLNNDYGHEIHELDDAFETTRERGTSNGTSDTEDDPDPELLVSHQDTDTD